MVMMNLDHCLQMQLGGTRSSIRYLGPDGGQYAAKLVGPLAY
jgi:hypothetical protein